jgi:pimeloyl-ACP methyl ester carboxylesterase
MPHFSSYDGATLAYHGAGEGDVLVCLPGGPGLASRYLGDLGGLTEYRRLIRLDNRGTGDSAVPADPAGYRCDRLVEDVDALRAHLGLERMDLLAHSAAGNLAVLYAARHPDRLRRLILVTPGLRAAGVDLPDDEWREAILRQSGRPWYEDAYAAITAWDKGEETPEIRARAAPLFYGRWNDAIAEHARQGSEDRATEAAEGFYGDGVFDPERTRAELARLDAPVLVLAGDLDPAPTPARAAELAALFPNGHLNIDPASAHYPWITAPRTFVSTVEDFLR